MRKGEKNQIIFEYPNIQPNNAILDELESFADAITENKNSGSFAGRRNRSFKSGA
jgi:hypothetical protein